MAKFPGKLIQERRITEAFKGHRSYVENVLRPSLSSSS